MYVYVKRDGIVTVADKILVFCAYCNSVRKRETMAEYETLAEVDICPCKGIRKIAFRLVLSVNKEQRLDFFRASTCTKLLKYNF